MSTSDSQNSRSSFLFKMRVELVGLAQDFWKDGGREVPTSVSKTSGSVSKSLFKKIFSGASKKEKEKGTIVHGRWSADRLSIKEKIWGAEQVLPINEELSDMLIKPFGLNKQMSVLDLSAGLGSLARKMAKDFGVYVTGCEADAEIAAAGMAQSVIKGQSKHAEIIAYDPETYKPSRHYDCVVLRDLFYRISNKKRFLEAVLTGLKSEGQIAITDFVLDKELHSEESVKHWLAYEKGASPVSLDEMTKVLAHMRLDVRIGEDLTSIYLHEILKKLGLFAAFLAKYPPDRETRFLVLKEIEFWAFRAAAMQHGLKFCRYYAIKH